jgi:hypothetical protein
MDWSAFVLRILKTDQSLGEVLLRYRLDAMTTVVKAVAVCAREGLTLDSQV